MNVKATYLITIFIGLILGLLFYFLFRKKNIHLKTIQIISGSWILCTFYLGFCFSFMEIHETVVLFLRAKTYFILVQIVPLISLITLYFLYRFNVSNSDDTNDYWSRIKQTGKSHIFLGATASMCVPLIYIIFPFLNCFLHQIAILFGLMLFVGIIVGLSVYWFNKRKSAKKNTEENP